MTQKTPMFSKLTKIGMAVLACTVAVAAVLLVAEPADAAASSNNGNGNEVCRDLQVAAVSLQNAAGDVVFCMHAPDTVVRTYSTFRLSGWLSTPALTGAGSSLTLTLVVDTTADCVVLGAPVTVGTSATAVSGAQTSTTWRLEFQDNEVDCHGYVQAQAVASGTTIFNAVLPFNVQAEDWNRVVQLTGGVSVGVAGTLSVTESGTLNVVNSGTVTQAHSGTLNVAQAGGTPWKMDAQERQCKASAFGAACTIPESIQKQWGSIANYNCLGQPLAGSKDFQDQPANIAGHCYADVHATYVIQCRGPAQAQEVPLFEILADGDAAIEATPSKCGQPRSFVMECAWNSDFHTAFQSNEDPTAYDCKEPISAQRLCADTGFQDNSVRCEYLQQVFNLNADGTTINEGNQTFNLDFGCSSEKLEADPYACTLRLENQPDVDNETRARPLVMNAEAGVGGWFGTLGAMALWLAVMVGSFMVRKKAPGVVLAAMGFAVVALPTFEAARLVAVVATLAVLGWHAFRRD